MLQLHRHISMATNYHNKVMLVLMNGASYGITGLQICPLCGFPLLLQPHLVPAVSQHLRHAPIHQHMGKPKLQIYNNIAAQLCSLSR